MNARASSSALFAIFSVSFAASLLIGGACTKLLPHGGDKPLYELVGRHAFVPCEGCHGTGTPKTESRVCVDCHAVDRPDPGHYPNQSCDGAGCHTPVGWLASLTTGETGITHTGVTPPTHSGTPGDPIHDTLPPDQLCWDCHEVDRKDPEHYADPLALQARWWDCGPCHDTKTWESTYEHPCRTPHGSGGLPDDWVVACNDCHSGGNTAVTDCVTCHATIFPHFGVDAAADVDPKGQACTLACHPTGD